MDGYLPSRERDALMNACDCYVSLHRSEGFGLTLAEAMALGKPTIATAYSGNIAFMTPENSFLVPWRPGRVPPGCEPYPKGDCWAEPDLDAAASLMRLVTRIRFSPASVDGSGGSTSSIVSLRRGRRLSSASASRPSRLCVGRPNRARFTRRRPASSRRRPTSRACRCHLPAAAAGCRATCGSHGADRRTDGAGPAGRRRSRAHARDRHTFQNATRDSGGRDSC